MSIEIKVRGEGRAKGKSDEIKAEKIRDRR